VTRIAAVSKPKRDRWPHPYLLLTLTALFWAGNAVIGRALHDDIPPIALAFWRWLFALLLVLPIAYPALREQWPLIRACWRRLVFLGAIGVGSYNTLLYAALQTTTATNGVLIPSFSPVLIAAVGYVFFAERIALRQWAGLVISLAGVLVIAGRGDFMALGRLDVVTGDLLLLLAAVLWAVYTVCLRWRPAGLASIAFVTITIAVGVLLLFPLYLLEMSTGRTLTLSPGVAAGLAYVAVFPSLLAYLFWNRGVAVLGANRAGIFINLVPVFGVALAVLVLGETLEPFHWAGAALVFAGLALNAGLQRPVDPAG
jgi:drug/metabolite transporter (DMT)-like permease